MIFVYLCVIVCQLFYDMPIKNVYSSKRKAYINTSDVSFISPFEWFHSVCNSCFSEWQTYVQNASLYTSFLLFTRKSGMNYTVVDVGNIQLLLDGNFNFSTSTKILVHGWMDNGTNFFAEDVRNAYLLAEDVNVIAVNWPELSQLVYPLARSAVIPVGQYIAAFADFLVINTGLSPKSIHLIGHSLGAHIAGVVGEYVTFGNLSRVTGLDPAAPLFSSTPVGRLNPSDADFVDVIHTTGYYLGYFDPCGDIDFYPNEGIQIQPGCGLDLGYCSHKRAYMYFVESIKSLGFISTACDNWNDFTDGLCCNNTKTVMGEHANISAKGNFYLHTNSRSPFAAWNKSLNAISRDFI